MFIKTNNIILNTIEKVGKSYPLNTTIAPLKKLIVVILECTHGKKHGKTLKEFFATIDLRNHSFDYIVNVYNALLLIPNHTITINKNNKIILVKN